MKFLVAFALLATTQAIKVRDEEMEASLAQTAEPAGDVSIED